MTNAREIEFEKLLEQLIQVLVRQNPVRASMLGLHEQDEDLIDFAPKAMQRRKNRLLDLKGKLKKINRRFLSPDNKVDHELAIAAIDSELLDLQKCQLHTCHPGVYLDQVVFGVYSIISNTYGTTKERGISALRRMVQAPTLLRQAMRNVKEPPRPFVEMTQEATAGALAFFRLDVIEFGERLKGTLRETFLEEATSLFFQLQEFENWLQDETLPDSNRAYCTGKTVFNGLLHSRLHWDGKYDDAEKRLDALLDDTEKEMQQVAGEIKKGAKWKDLYNEIEKDHPTARYLVSSYTNEIKRVRRFLEKSKLFPLNEELDAPLVLPTIGILEPQITFSGYGEIDIFSENRKGTMWVTVPKNLPRATAEKLLRGHPRDALNLVVSRHIFPGDHLRNEFHSKVGRSIRFLAENPAFTGGWPLYCEEVLKNEGLFLKPETRLLQLHHRFWKTCLAKAEIGLHCHSLSYKDAVEMLVKRCGLKETHADKEIRLVCQQPVRATGEVLGYLDLMELAEETRKKDGKNFDPEAFHRNVLSHGPVSIANLRYLMQETGIESEEDTNSDDESPEADPKETSNE